MKIAPFWLVRYSFANMNPFEHCASRLPYNIFCLLVGVAMRLVLAHKRSFRTLSVVMVTGWLVLEILADIAIVTEVGSFLTVLSIEGGSFFLMACLGFFLTDLVRRLNKDTGLS